MTNQGSVATIVNEYISFRSLYNLAIPPYNPVSGVQYSGKNIDKLNEEVKEQGYTDPRWFTFIQGKSLGYKLKKGSKSVRLFKFGEKKENPETTELFKNMGIGAKPDTYTAPFYVFNAENFENVPPFECKYTPEEIQEIFKKIMANSSTPFAKSRRFIYYDEEDQVIRAMSPENAYNIHVWRTNVLYNIVLAESIKNKNKLKFFSTMDDKQREVFAYVTALMVQGRLNEPYMREQIAKLLQLKIDIVRKGYDMRELTKFLQCTIETARKMCALLFKGIELKPLPLLTPSDDKTPLETVIKEVTEMQGVELKQSGSWYWASGNTKAFKEKLKELSFRFSRKRCAWYYVAAM